MPISTAQRLAKRIKELRIERGMTQEEAAKKCGIKYKYYQERGVDAVELAEYAKVYNKDINHFIN